MAASPLTPEQQRDLEQRLLARRTELRDEIEQELKQSDDPRVIGLKNELAETEDWVLADILADLDIAMVTRDMQELSEVEAALVRIADGSYGICTDGGEPIGWPRLNAYPSALRCVRCQERAEARPGRPAPPSL